jgi:hypothetical protein
MNRLVSTFLFVTLAVSPVWAVEPVGEGEECGGVVPIRCKPNLECQLPGDGGTLGKCVAASSSREKAGPGEMCGGIAAIQCEDGLSCTGMADHPDASGKCSERPQ